MRLRTLSLIAVLALVAAACGSSPDSADTTEGGLTAPTTTSAPVVETTTTTVEAGAPEAVRLSYNLVPGETYTYHVGIDQRIDLTAEGDSTAMGDEEIPGELSVDFKGTTVFTHSVDEGPEPGTYSVRITGDFADLTLSGLIDGEPIDEAELPDFAAMDPIDVTVIVDEQGNIIPQDEDMADLFGGDLGGLGSVDDFAGMGGDFGQFLGPPFSDEEVTVGDTWSQTIEIPGFMTEDPITTEINSVVTDSDTIDGHEVFVIDTESVTSAIEFDLAQFLIGFLTAFIPEDATDEEKAEIEALTQEMKFLFSLDETVSNMTTWFDPETGYARQAELDSSAHLVMDMRMPDEETGELIEFLMDMTIAQNVTYELTDTSGA